MPRLPPTSALGGYKALPYKSKLETARAGFHKSTVIYVTWNVDGCDVLHNIKRDPRRKQATEICSRVLEGANRAGGPVAPLALLKLAVWLTWLLTELPHTSKRNLPGKRLAAADVDSNRQPPHAQSSADSRPNLGLVGKDIDRIDVRKSERRVENNPDRDQDRRSRL